ncbi:MAG: Fe(3+) ABC transporter substrate-binding protein [Verrucomicrobiales bacterium]|jgi:iron(III) transport system substrate-binding protein|nr:Fe(3+) ABC transporter substrate-binding protein [Verrucomicrobiales bacterium]
MIKILSTILILGAALQAFAETKEVTLYTQRHYAFDEAVHDKLLKEKGIKVNVVKASADELIARLEEEGANTPADLFMTADGAGLDRAQKVGLLQPITSPVVLGIVPETLKDPENHWVAITNRARVIIYSKDRVKPEELSTYEDLADPKWRGRIVIRSSSNSYNQSLMTTIIAANGEEKAGEWAAAVRKNMARPPQGSDRDQIRAVAAGLADLAVANTYYVGLLETSEEPNDREAATAVALYFPNQEGRGTHVNISGIGVVKGTKKAELAEQVIEFLLSEEVQSRYPENTFEYPVNPAATWSENQERWGKFKADPVPLSTLGELNAEAVRLFNRAGWE